MTGRWSAYPPQIAPAPPRNSSRGWTIAGLLLLAAGVGYVVLRPRVYTTPDGERLITVTPPVRGDERALAAIASADSLRTEPQGAR